jgi:membrane associated rhomboid family serine protease
MIPLRDVIPSRTTPWVTFSLIGLNLTVFAWAWFQGALAFSELAGRYGVVPANFSWASVVTSMFLHSGWGHLISNIWALWIFGDNVEDRMGHGRFIVFYLLIGAAASLVEAWAHPASGVPRVGASGAIAGVMAAYVVLFPSSRILVLVFFVFLLDVVEIPAAVFLAVWFVFQVFWGVGRVDEFGGASIAYWAHLAGFAAGLAAVWLFRRRERETPDWWTR